MYSWVVRRVSNMYRDHSFIYKFPKEVGGWKYWAYSKILYNCGGRVTVLGFTVEWMDYMHA